MIVSDLSQLSILLSLLPKVPGIEAAIVKLSEAVVMLSVAADVFSDVFHLFDMVLSQFSFLCFYPCLFILFPFSAFWAFTMNDLKFSNLVTYGFILEISLGGSSVQLGRVSSLGVAL